MQLYLSLDYIFLWTKNLLFKCWYTVFPALEGYLISIGLSADVEGYIYILTAD